MEILLDTVVTCWTRWVWPILQFVIGLGVVVLVHEMGHFLAAKWARIKVLTFSVGMGWRLWSFKRGETEYRLSAVPIGGYVHMLGQDDFKATPPDQAEAGSWQAAKPGKKLIVLAAGVTMNVVLTLLAFVVVYMAGIRFIAPVVGGVRAGFPAATAPLPQAVADAMGVDKAVGLRPGDRILAINGKPVRRFRELGVESSLSAKGESFVLSVRREIADKTIDFDVTLVPKEDTSEKSLGSPYVFGISAATTITKPAAHHYAGAARFAEGDIFGDVAGLPMGLGGNLTTVVDPTAGAVEVTALRRDGEQLRRVAVPVKPYLFSDGKEMLAILGMAARLEIGMVQPGSPAEAAGLKSGDVIVEYAGIENPSRTQIAEANAALYRTQTYIRVLRQGQVVEARLTPRRQQMLNVIGVILLPAQDEAVVARAVEGSPAAEAGIGKGATLNAVNAKPVKSWPEVYNALKAAGDGEVVLAYTVGGEQREARIEKLSKDVFDPLNPKKFVIHFPAAMLSETEALPTPVVRLDPLRAIVWGFRDTRNWIVRTYKSLLRLIQLRVSPKGAAGPVGIGAFAIGIARRSPIDLVYFMAMLSAIIAVFNFLPLPVLDGGHAVLVLIEKVRGRPLPVKVVAGIQITGWVLILGLFVAVTFQDIMRLVSRS